MSTDEPTVNPWRAFQNLLPRGGRSVVTITANLGDGTSSATLRDGTPITVRGEDVAPGGLALIHDGAILAEVPALPQTSVSV